MLTAPLGSFLNPVPVMLFWEKVVTFNPCVFLCVCMHSCFLSSFIFLSAVFIHIESRTSRSASCYLQFLLWGHPEAFTLFEHVFNPLPPPDRWIDGQGKGLICALHSFVCVKLWLLGIKSTAFFPWFHDGICWVNGHAAFSLFPFSGDLEMFRFACGFACWVLDGAPFLSPHLPIWRPELLEVLWLPVSPHSCDWAAVQSRH